MGARHQRGMFALIANLNNHIQRLIWGNQLTRTGAPGRILAIVLRFLYAMVRDFFSGQLTMRAMSLVFTTLLSVVPLLAFSFAILKGFGVFNELEPYLKEVLVSQLGEQGERIAETLLTLVDNVRGSVLGGAGLAFFIWTAISTVQKIEESFNYTWYVSRPRSFSRRLTTRPTWLNCCASSGSSGSVSSYRRSIRSWPCWPSMRSWSCAGG